MLKFPISGLVMPPECDRTFNCQRAMTIQYYVTEGNPLCKMQDKQDARFSYQTLIYLLCACQAERLMFLILKTVYVIFIVLQVHAVASIERTPLRDDHTHSNNNSPPPLAGRKLLTTSSG